MEVEEAVEVARMDDEVRREPAIAKSATRPIVLALLIFASLSSFCAIRSKGFISGDACIHYFAARYAFAHPENFVDVWSRPLITTLYAGPAWLAGREGIRIVSMLVAAGCGLVAFRIARGQGLKYPALALFFTLGQPLLFLHSFSEMTELPFALLLGLAFMAWQEKRFWLAAILVSWTPLARPEGFGIVAIVALGLLVLRRWKQLLVLPIPVILWDVVGWAISDHRSLWWCWLKDNWPYSGESMYGKGSLFVFVMILPMIISPMVLPAMFLGIWRSFFPGSECDKDIAGESAPLLSPLPVLRERVRVYGFSTVDDRRHLRLCVILTAALPLFILVAHSVLFRLGKMASAGEPRYLIVVAPFWGVLSARGWEWAFAQFRLRHILSWAATAVLAPPLIVNAIYPGVPVPFWHDWDSARQIAAWVQASPLRKTHPKTTTSHPGVYYFFDVNPYRSPQVQAWGKDTLHERPADTILIWDPIFGGKNASEELTMTLPEIRRAGWVEVEGPILQENGDGGSQGSSTKDDPSRRWHVFVTP